MDQRQHLKILLMKELERRRQEQRRYDWGLNARDNQRPPEGSWRTWMILAGRGFGKTRTGAETLRQWIKEGKSKRIALIGGSLHEVRSVMVEGESGLLNVHPAQERPLYIPSKRLIKWKNGAVAQFFGAEAYEQLRGPQFDCAWIDELAKFRKAEEVWQQLQLCLRLGDNPRCILTTTPRPTKLMKELISSPDVVVTKGSTFDNIANLAPTYIDQIRKQFLNTRLGAQELYAEMLTETAGALWQRTMIQYQQPPYEEASHRPALERIVIAIDPATTTHDHSDETGIIVAGIDANKQAYVLEDHSGKLSPNDWGRRVVDCYYRLNADRIVVEINKGGDLVENVLKSIDPTIPLKVVRATRGKYTRAEPIAALYEQKRVFHAQPFTLLEQQICDYIPGITSKSPDRMDALVWALTELLLESQKQPTLKIWG